MKGRSKPGSGMSQTQLGDDKGKGGINYEPEGHFISRRYGKARKCTITQAKNINPTVDQRLWGSAPGGRGMEGRGYFRAVTSCSYFGLLFSRFD